MLELGCCLNNISEKELIMLRCGIKIQYTSISSTVESFIFMDEKIFCIFPKRFRDHDCEFTDFCY